MKEKLILPPTCKGELWLYNKERFLDHSYQSFLHRHDELELNLVLCGRGVYLLDGQKIEMGLNSILWLFPEQEHLLFEKSLDFEMWILVVRQEYLREICTDESSQVLLADDPGENFYRSLPNHPFQKLSNLCRETLALKNDLALFNISLGYILLSTWSAYQSGGKSGIQKNLHPAIEKTVRRIIDSMGKDDLPFLAQKAGLSPTSLSRLFNKHMGISLTTFRNRCRVEQFLDLYGDGQTRTMLDAALEAGFGSYAQFYRVFNQIMGGSPSDYRRSLGAIKT